MQNKQLAFGMMRLPQLDGADYGDLAQMAMRQKALKRERAEIAR